MEKHAVFATSFTPDGPVTFRVGQPVDWTTAQARWQRLDDRRIAGKRPAVKTNRRQYPVRLFEVRSVDRHGRGLGSERHTTALTTPYRATKVTR